MSAVSRRVRIASLVGAVFLAIQLVVPAAALFGPRPARFAWHMYSALPPVPEAWIVHADGSTEVVDVTGLFVVPRAEIDYAEALRGRLCDVSGAVEIQVRPDADGPMETIRCT
jgi:hypothetical protein